MLDVSDNFHSAEISDVNKIIGKVYLLLGNYATSAFGSSASASTTFSADYPASGSIDGDRTELNVGPASAAYNDVGQSSWRSLMTPSITPQSLKINFGQVRVFNRIKLYHLFSSPLKAFKFSWSADDISYTDFAGTNGYYSGVNSFDSTSELDTLDLVSDITARYLLITISDTVNPADHANIVEVEVYRKVDITDYVTRVSIERSRDYQLSNSMASTISVTCANVDRFFSPDYEPTTNQIAAGFVNSELKPGIGIIAKLGFNHAGGEETKQVFIGSIDRLSVQVKNRQCVLEGRDGMKALFNRNISAKLKTSQDIGALIPYILGIANISNYEISTDLTSINIDYFFTNDETIITTIHDLVEACGDAQFYFDEDGIATFRMYLNSIPHQSVFSSEADWEGGTLTNIDSTSDPDSIMRKWFILDDFSDGQITTNPIWTAGTGDTVIGTGWDASTGELVYSSQPSLNNGHAIFAFTRAYGTWSSKIRMSGADKGKIRFFFITNYIFPDFGGQRAMGNGYCVEINRQGSPAQFTMKLIKFSGGLTETVLTSGLATPQDGTAHTLRVTRDGSGAMNVYWDGVLIMTATDNTFTFSTYLGLYVSPASTSGFSFGFDDIYYSYAIDPTSSLSSSQAVWTSPIIDQGITVIEEGSLDATYVAPTGTSVQFQTRTSSDGSTWSDWSNVSPGDQISSSLARYLQTRTILSCPQDSAGHYTNTDTPLIQDITVNWTTGAGSIRIPASRSFTFNEDLNLSIQQDYTDTIGGTSAIINHANVTAQPLILTGTDSDLQWQGTVGSPPSAIAAGNPKSITNGQTLTFPIVVEQGMDISRMSGANPAAASITFSGGGAGSWIFSTIHPTRPVLKITVTGTGTITALTVNGKSFSNDNTFLAETDEDTNSIKQYDERLLEISNKWIVSNSIAQAIATALVDNFSTPKTFIPEIKIRPTFSVQIGDRCGVQDSNLSIDDDYLVIGVIHNFASADRSGDADTALQLLRITV